MQYNKRKSFQKGRIILRRPIIPGLKERKINIDSLHRPITSQLELMERLRRVRTQDYLQTFSDLDLDSHADLNVNSLVRLIEQEFSDVPQAEQLVGIVAKCYLSDIYDVHLLDRDQTIVQHVKKSDLLSTTFEKARGLALHPNYQLIEIYKDCIRAVTKTGEVSVVRE